MMGECLLRRRKGKRMELPVFTGSYAIFGDAKQGYIEIYGSGVLTLDRAKYNACLVGAGAAGAGSGTNTYNRSGTNGGAGGYTANFFQQLLEGQYDIAIGAGGARLGKTSATSTGGNTAISVAGTVLYQANGANAINGGSGAGLHSPETSGSAAGRGGSDGSNGTSSGSSGTGGAGQGTSTRAFGRPTGTLYAAGGGGGANIAGTGEGDEDGSSGAGGAGGGGNGGAANSDGVAATANTGSGGGGSGGRLSTTRYSGAGAAGIIIIEWGTAA